MPCAVAEVYGDGFPFDRAADMLFVFILAYNKKHTMPLKDGAMDCLRAIPRGDCRSYWQPALRALW
jgi:hypothetical protein